MALLKLQKSFKKTLNHPEETYFFQQVKESAVGAEARFDIYKNNIQSSFVEILEASYPLVQKLIGKECMRGVSLLYIQGNLPEIAAFNEWPENFPNFLVSLSTLKDLPYLQAVARFEWFSLLSIQSADKVGVTPEAFSEQITQHMNAATDFTITLHPSSFLMQSPYPLEPIFKIAKDEIEAYELINQEGYYLIFREGSSVKLKHLSAGEFTFLSNLLDKKTFDFSFDQALLKDPDFDVESLFTFLLQATLICSIN